MIGASLLGIVGGFAYTLILLNPGFKFSKLDISRPDFAWALAVNAFLGGVAGFLGWSFSGGQIAPPKAYGLYVLCGVGGGSLIQNWAFSLNNMQSKATLDRALDTIEALGRVQSGTEGDKLESLSRSLRSETDSQQRSNISRELAELANKLAAQSGR